MKSIEVGAVLILLTLKIEATRLFVFLLRFRGYIFPESGSLPFGIKVN